MMKKPTVITPGMIFLNPINSCRFMTISIGIHSMDAIYFLMNLDHPGTMYFDHNEVFCWHEDELMHYLEFYGWFYLAKDARFDLTDFTQIVPPQPNDDI
jgi:hypothetical protein